MAKLFLARFPSDNREVLLLGQLYPPCVAVVAVEEVEAMHRVVGSAGHADIDLYMRGDDQEAFKLIAPFAGRLSEPINPTWRPTRDLADSAISARGDVLQIAG